jgi:TP53 regulating kinase-like protein
MSSIISSAVAAAATTTTKVVTQMDTTTEEEEEEKETKKQQQQQQQQDDGTRLIQQGAEARVFSTTFMGRAAIRKERFRKQYRLAVLDDKLRRQRTAAEAKCLYKARRLGIDAPAVYNVDTRSSSITMEHVYGVTVRDYIRQSGVAAAMQAEADAAKAAAHPDAKVAAPTASTTTLAARIGIMLNMLHQGNLVHGDLTTSNMMLRYPPDWTGPSKTQQFPELASMSLVLIDFGLAYKSHLVEDKAVDLYVLERAFLSTHPNSERFFQAILNAYQNRHGAKVSLTMTRLRIVRQRGRKRSMVG